MITPLLITYLILGVAILALLSDRLRPDLIALLVAISLGVSGVLTSQEVFSGFSRSAVITILAIFILAEGLQRTGVTNRVGKILVRIAGPKESWLATIVMISGATLSLFMNNIAAASVLLPAVAGAARKTHTNPSRLLMPLAYGTILGGMATLFTTTNIVVSSLLRDRNLAGFGVLDFLPLGIPLVLTGVVYMAWIGRLLLPSESWLARLASDGEDQEPLADIYRLGERLIRARVNRNSRLVGLGLGESRLRQEFNLNLVGIERNGHKLVLPTPDLTFRREDVLWLEGRPDELADKDTRLYFDLLPSQDLDGIGLESRQAVLVEAVLAPRSELIGKTLREVHFREKYKMAVIAIWRAGRPVRTGLSDLPLQFGDALLLQGPQSQLPVLGSETNLILLAEAGDAKAARRSHAWLAIAIMVATIVLAASGLLPVAEVMFGGALVMVLSGLLSMDQAYQAVEWKSIFLVAGMLPMGIAMAKTGAADGLADTLLKFLGPAGPMALLAGVTVLAILLTQVIHGAAVSAMIAPIAIDVALKTGIEPHSLAMAVAVCTSMAFITPLGHPVNVLVMSPGGYRFRDFLKVGLPLTLILFVEILLLLPIVWPLK
jgi:di/tricarboxylate transporter